MFRKVKEVIEPSRKSLRQQRIRPDGSRVPTPPPEIPLFEEYVKHRKTGKIYTSSSICASSKKE